MEYRVVVAVYADIIVTADTAEDAAEMVEMAADIGMDPSYDAVVDVSAEVESVDPIDEGGTVQTSPDT
jgi:hypothetical protein